MTKHQSGLALQGTYEAGSLQWDASSGKADLIAAHALLAMVQAGSGSVYLKYRVVVSGGSTYSPHLGASLQVPLHQSPDAV